MDQQRRILIFVTLSMLILVGWSNFVVPLFFPDAFKQPPAPNVEADAAALDRWNALLETPADALHPLNVTAATAQAVAQPDATPKHPHQSVSLGSDDPKTGFFLKVELTTLGAAVETIEFNDPRYTAVNQGKTPLKMVGNDPTAAQKTFAIRLPVPVGGGQPAGAQVDLEGVDWEIVPESQTPSAVSFRLVTSDGKFELTKTYELGQAPLDVLEQPHLRDTRLDSYGLKLTVSAKNLTDSAQLWQYELQGPVGTPLEDPKLATKWRDVRMGFLQDDGTGLDESQLPASEVVSQADENNLEIWKRHLKYLGIDVQYFAALIVPVEDQQKNPTVASSSPELVERTAEPQHSDISVLLQSQEVNLAPGGSVEQGFSLYSLPKRKELLSQIDAYAVTDFGWLGWICEAMLFILVGLNDLGMNYGLAIICLTIIVRTLLFPFSRKQALNVEKMKELQPKIKELQQKYGKDKEAMARAQMELFSKNNYNPFSGCLTLVLQMPIFFGLYRALYGSVDLRNAHFLWIENLAAPDKLFPLGFTVPYFGWTDFNLLPICTIFLFVGQQKLMMPPPADEEQAMQYRMMNIMMVVMGFMFYTVASGLCLYFIASSVWGMAERWLLTKFKPKPAPAGTPEVIVDPSRSGGPSNNGNRTTKTPDGKPSYLGELWQKMQEAADKQATASRPGGTVSKKPKKGKGPKN